MIRLVRGPEEGRQLDLYCDCPYSRAARNRLFDGAGDDAYEEALDAVGTANLTNRR
jgi:hypothetical protein